MKKLSMIIAALLMFSIAARAQEFKTYENKAFSIEYPASWQVSWDADEWVNLSTDDDVIRFSCTYNESGPTKAQLKECVDNYIYMIEGNGHKVDQKLVKDDYALVRSIYTDEDDGSQSVEVWYIMISKEPESFSGTIEAPISRADETLDVLVSMLATLSPK